jgi:hypoxanthine phosphoribosyltransferase
MVKGIKPNLRLLYDSKEIRDGVKRLAGEIDRDYYGKTIVMVGVLKGAFVFLSDLVRSMKTELTVDFIQVASYGSGTTPAELRLIKDINLPVYKQDVILVDDIIDTGYTIRFLYERLHRRKPASLSICTLLDKPSKREVEVPIHYLGFTVPDIFVVGYGIDLDEKYRKLPDIYGIEVKTKE